MEEMSQRAEQIAKRSREGFREIRKSSTEKRNAILATIAGKLRDKNERAAIIAANSLDLKRGEQDGLSGSLMDRLALNEKRIDAMAEALDQIRSFPDPVGEVILGRTLSGGLQMIQKRVPLGSVFTIFESRPNVTIDVAALCLKSGNAAILRGGKEALDSNRALYRLFLAAVEQHGLPGSIIQLVDDPDRDLMAALLKQDQWIDLVVPRGGEGLIRYVSANSRIPVVKHDKGVCTLFVDRDADPEIALAVSANAKLQRPSVCNAIENLVIDRRYPGIVALLQGLEQRGARLLGCPETIELYPAALPIANPDEEYATEYLDERLSVKLVADQAEAIDFIHRYSSGHSEGIISENASTIRTFLESVDSAALMVNCSTRFHDGGEMGMGAEVGISTGRLHVRGPMGLRDLTTTTYILNGSGQIRK